MTRRPPSDPRSPVQDGGSNGTIPILLVAALLAVLLWSWQQDWTSDTLTEVTAPDAGQPLPAPEQALPVSSSGEPPAQRARANLASYITDDDYPAAAIRNGDQGTVAFVLTVSPEGPVTGCRIAESSGSSQLDAATCRLLRSRARFQPARNAAGEAVPDEMSGRIKWVLPAG